MVRRNNPPKSAKPPAAGQQKTESDNNKTSRATGNEATSREKSVVKPNPQKNNKGKIGKNNTVTDASTNISSKTNTKTAKDLTTPENIKQKQAKVKQSDDEKSDIAVKGEIRVISIDKPNKRRVNSSYYVADKREIHIGDEDVKIVITVNEGSQVVCNSRRVGEIDQTIQTYSPAADDLVSLPASDIESCSEKGQGADIENSQEKDNETTSDAKCHSSILKKSSSRKCQTDDQVDHPKVDTVNKQENIKLGTKNLSSTGDDSERNDFSSSNSLENIQHVCEMLLEEVGSACSTFQTRFENHLSNSISIKEQ